MEKKTKHLEKAETFFQGDIIPYFLPENMKKVSACYIDGVKVKHRMVKGVYLTVPKELENGKVLKIMYEIKK